jgi:hypothetical protein
VSRRKPRPRQDRWLTLLQVAERMRQMGHDDLPEKRPERRDRVRRDIRRLEQLHEVPLSKLHAGKLYVSIQALDHLKPLPDPTEAVLLPDEVSRVRVIAEETRDQIRALKGRVRKLESRATLTERYLADLAKLG